MQLIFDQVIGDIFNARVAGNFVKDASGSAALL
jgi:carbonic anhydrase